MADEFDEPIEEETDRTILAVSAALVAVILASSSDGKGGGEIKAPPTGWYAPVSKVVHPLLARFAVRAVDRLRRWAPRKIRDSRVLAVVAEVVGAAEHKIVDIVHAGWEEWGPAPTPPAETAVPAETRKVQVREAEEERLRRIKVDADRAARAGTLAVRERSRYLVAQEVGAVYKVWRSRRDNRVRPTHGDLEGNRVPLGNHFVAASGASLMFPGDPSAPLNETAGCRCRLSYLVRETP